MATTETTGTADATTGTTASDTEQHGIRATAEKALGSARDAAGSAIDATRDAATKTASALEDNPLALLASGIALGAVIGAVLPRLAKEKELLGPLGQRLADSATAAIQAARDAGKAELESLIPDKDAAKDRASQFVGTIVQAAKGAATQH